MQLWIWFNEDLTTIMLFVIQYIILNSMFHRIQILYSVEQSIPLSAHAYIAAKTTHYLALVSDACSPIMECTTGFLFRLVYNVTNTSIQSQNQSSRRLQNIIFHPTGSLLDATIGCNCSTGWCSRWKKWNCWQSWRGCDFKFKYTFLTFLLTCYQVWINPVFGNWLSKLILIFVLRFHTFLLAHLQIQFVRICQEYTHRTEQNWPPSFPVSYPRVQPVYAS